MREILFKGKRIAVRDWVYGFYVHIPKGRWCDNEYLIQTVDEDGSIGKLCNIDPDTVGQYTGLKDRNSERIFEGDIVKVDGKHYEVKYMFGQFFVGMNMPIAYKRFDCEVIGNIHDNPELLEGT